MTAPWTEYDVVVVGSGAAALTTAFAAASQGWDTAVLERTDRVGGTSAYSGGACWLPGSAVQRAAGLDDSTESARTYLDALLGDYELARREAFLNAAPRLVDDLAVRADLFLEFRPFPEYFEAPGRVRPGRSLTPADLPVEELGDLLQLVRPPVDRDRVGKGHRPGPLSGGAALVGRLLRAFLATGHGTVRTGHLVDKLVVADCIVPEGIVVGVEADTAAGRELVYARHGVVLASGGFEGSDVLRRRYGVAGSAEWSMAPRGTNRGEALVAAMDAGAAGTLLDQAWWCPAIELPDGTAGFTLGFRGGLVVDQHGRRFANESLPYDRLGRAMAADQARVPSYLVFDARFDGRLPAIAMPAGRPEEHLSAGTWVRADSLPELAGQLGVPADALAESVTTFNGFAVSGVDEHFHRGEDAYDRFFASGGSPNQALVPVDQPPYYAARLVLSDLGTKGGLQTDPRGRVLRPDGDWLQGLYAVGNAAASLTGPVYPAPGAPIGTGMVAGMLAAEDMVAVLDASIR